MSEGDELGWEVLRLTMSGLRDPDFRRPRFGRLERWMLCLTSRGGTFWAKAYAILFHVCSGVYDQIGLRVR